jgi:hypothetical protein
MWPVFAKTGSIISGTGQIQVQFAVLQTGWFYWHWPGMVHVSKFLKVLFTKVSWAGSESNNVSRVHCECVICLFCLLQKIPLQNLFKRRIYSTVPISEMCKISWDISNEKIYIKLKVKTGSVPEWSESARQLFTFQTWYIYLIFNELFCM